MITAWHIRYWGKPIREEGRTNTNISDGILIRGESAALAAIVRLTIEGHAIHSVQEITVTNPNSCYFRSLAEYREFCQMGSDRMKLFRDAVRSEILAETEPA